MSSSSDSKPTPRFGSLSSPSSFRPSYSGGTYRSLGIKRETPVTPSYSSRWLSPTNKTNTTKDVESIKKPSTKLSQSVTDTSNDTKSNRSAAVSSTSGSSLTKTKPKESILNSTRPTVAKVRIRDVSSSNSSYSTSKSRDPSPCEPTKDRYTSSSGYVSSSYSKLYPRSSNKLQVNSYSSRSSQSSSTPAVSYLNGSDVGGRYRRNIDKNENPTKTPPKENSPAKEKECQAVKSDSSDSSETQCEKNIEMIEMTVVTRSTSPNLCSTTTSNFSRCRRVEIAKTIEKTVMRPKQKPKSEDKEVQSDRMDDTSKYCRFSSSRASTPWPSYMESKYNSVGYSRYSSGTTTASLSKYSTSKSDKDSNESSPEKTVSKIIEKTPEKSPEKSPSKSSRESSISKSPSISRSNSIKNVSKNEKSKSKSPPVPSSKSTSTSPSKQKVYNNKTLPPQPPKLESPTKVISVTSSTSSSVNTTASSKWANKDFRKSALNVGPSDRPRKARTSSTSTDNDDLKKMQQKPATNQMPFTRSERSPSVSSETSHSSGGNADDMTKNFMKLKISPSLSPPPLSPQSLPTVAAAAAATPNPTELMHLNSDTVTYELKSQPNAIVQNQPNISQHSNESCMKSENTTNSIVNRVLGPVVKMFKTKTTQSGENQSCSDHDSAISTNDSIKQDTLYESMLNPTTTTISNGPKLVSSNNYLADESSWINSTINEQTTDAQFDRFQTENTLNMKQQLKHIDSSNQIPWWLSETDNDDTVAEDITLNQSENDTIRTNNADMDAVDGSQMTVQLPWWMTSDSLSASDAAQKYRIAPIRSGERAWWLDDDTEESVNDILEAAETEVETGSKFTFKIKKIESGERAWWLCEENEQTEPIDVTNENENGFDSNNQNENEDIDFWATINQSLEIKKSESKSREDQIRIQNSNSFENHLPYDINANYIPLGDRASPEGLEDLNNINENLRLPPSYDNNIGDTTNLLASSLKQLFISRHKNIDEVLGVPCHALSPVRTDNDNEPFEEILPNQVRIHDGTSTYRPFDIRYVFNSNLFPKSIIIFFIFSSFFSERVMIILNHRPTANHLSE